MPGASSTTSTLHILRRGPLVPLVVSAPFTGSRRRFAARRPMNGERPGRLVRPPLLAELRTRMEKTLRSLSPKSETAEAIRYVLSRWRALTRYLDDGQIEVDNSAAERALRAVALGRKNYLLCGSEIAGQVSLTIFLAPEYRKASVCGLSMKAFPEGQEVYVEEFRP